MVDFTSALVGITSSVIGRAFMVLGLGVASYGSLTTFETAVSTQILSNYHSIDTTVLQLLNLGGVGTFINILLSALAAKAALLSIKKIQVV
jgi:hypothetical protein